MIFTYVFTYSDTYINDGFKESMIPSIISFEIPDNLTKEAVYKRLVEIHHLLQLQKINESGNVVAEGEGFDWYGKEGYNAYVLQEVVAKITGWKIVDTKSITVADFDTM